MTDKQVILANTEALVGADLDLAFRAVRANQAPDGVVARFKKKEEIGRMTKSILKHKIQTLTGRSIKKLEEEMGYQAKDPNEPSMDIDTMRTLASSLVLLASGELPEYAAPPPAAAPAPVAGSKRAAPGPAQDGGSARKQARRSIAVPDMASTSSSQPLPATNGSAKKKLSRRSVAALPSSTAVSSPAAGARRPRRSELNTSGGSQVSQSVTSCLGPDKDTADHLAAVAEEADAEAGDQTLANPTPLMKEMLKKRRSVATPKLKVAGSPKRAVAKGKPPLLDASDLQPAAVTRPASPPPRQDFPGPRATRGFLVAGDPLELKLSSLQAALPLSAGFSGCQLTVVHTPAEWAPTEVWQVTKAIKMMNREAGLASFVVLVGTGLANVHMNMEALCRHTKHVQFVTFHREDANLGAETGKLRETTSFFLAAYFFPGCDTEGSTLPSKMVRDGYTTCFRTESTQHLEGTIVDCFSEEGEWILDLCCGKRLLSVAAAEKGRSAVAFHHDADCLEAVGDYLRTLALKHDSSYRDKDGVVLNIVKQ